MQVVIVSYRSRDRLGVCLDSLARHPGREPLAIDVVDNASGDGTVEMLAAEHPEARLTANRENLGFGAASNQGIAAGTGPLALLLNPDTRIEAGTIDTLVDLMSAQPRAAVAGPALFTADGSPDHAAARSFPTPLSSLGHFSGLSRRPRAPAALRSYALEPSRPGPVDAVNGAFMLIRRAAFEQVGGFDEGYWMYMEDLDLCWRLREAGWETWFEPGARAFHEKGGSAGPVRSPRLNFAFHRGMARFYRRHYAADQPAALNASVYLGIAAKLGASTLGGFVNRARGR